ncbi:LysR family transcriptional regulator [Roseomonas sp. M0104]|uniref:LysR family transcriptional regulator n=1 Tax=Teichococcus coralli TaxID=2545983 RepID=A0A845BDX2_9PROT|nr:LysR family transcriptional regulator [Pseudoroseomonas coralli]MXP64958.1 LysR family transcriptional regulator [Pseudoroseomonas coralli]
MTPVTLRQMRAFLAIVRLGSFTAAARQLHLTQPALTVQLRQLEQTLGVRLLDRTTRTATPTRTGAEFARALAPLLAEMDAVLERVQDHAALRTGRIDLATLPSLASTVLPEVIARLRAASPGLRVRMREAVTGPVGEMVRAGLVDFGIGGSVAEDGELVVQHLFDDPLLLIFPRGHGFAARRAVALPELCDVPLLLPEANSGIRHAVDQAFAALGRAVEPAQEAVSTGTLVGMVRAGLGLGVLPSTAVEMQVSPDLRALPIGDPPLTRPIALVRRAGRSLSPAAEAFLAMLRECLALRADLRSLAGPCHPVRGGDP